MRSSFLIRLALAATAGIVLTGTAMAAPLIFRPINPSFGGDPLNGNWLLSQAQAQTSGGGSSSPGFTIDFPDFGNTPQAGVTNPAQLPQVPSTPTP